MELYLGLNVVNEKEYLSAMVPVFLGDFFRSGSKKRRTKADRCGVAWTLGRKIIELLLDCR